MGHDEHHKKAKGPVKCFVLTVSDTRTGDADSSGRMIRDALAEAGHVVTGSAIVHDDPDEIRRGAMESPPPDTQAVVVTGGTGISLRDATIDTLMPLMDFELRGFGELFRALSYAEIGSSAILSRATAGVIRGKRVFFLLPGSLNAVRLAMEKIILPELAHIVWEMNKEK